MSWGRFLCEVFNKHLECIGYLPEGFRAALCTTKQDASFERGKRQGCQFLCLFALQPPSLKLQSELALP